MNDYSEQRQKMVDEQIIARGVRDPLVIKAMRTVPREQFVTANVRAHAYEDRPLPIGEDQTISQPYMVALMAEALLLGGGERVLEIGTGSGYAAAVLAEIAGEVYSVERIERLASKATNTLQMLGYENVQVSCSDGTEGWSDEAPFDAITVAAAGSEVPQALKDQLQIDGRLVMPVGGPHDGQKLLRLTKRSADQFDSETLTRVSFVPLIRG